MNLGVSQKKIFVAASPSIPEDILSLSMTAAPHPWLEEANPVIIAMGRLVRDKGFDTLVKAFALVRHDLPAKLIILGEGPMRKELLKLAVEYEVEKFVDLPGFSENPFPYIRMCDLFVLSSRREGSPNVLIQALFLKAKVVATDCPSGPSEILTEEMSNYLVPPEDVEVMANRIFQALRTVQPTVDVEKFTVDAASVNYLHIFST